MLVKVKVTLNFLLISIKFYETPYFEDLQSKNTCLKTRQLFIAPLQSKNSPRRLSYRSHASLSSFQVGCQLARLIPGFLSTASSLHLFILFFFPFPMLTKRRMGNPLFFQDNDIQSWSGYLLILLVYHLCALVAEPLFFPFGNPSM